MEHPEVTIVAGIKTGATGNGNMISHHTATTEGVKL